MELNKIYHGDSMELLKNMPENSVDLIIADPFFNEWDKFYNLPLHMLKDDGVFIAFSNRPHTGHLQVELDKKMKFVTEIVWNFSDGRWVSNNLPRICHENILIYTKSKKNPLNDMRVLEWIEKPKQVKKGGASIGKWKTSERIYNPQDYSQLESVIYLPRNVGKHMGIVSKPVELIELLIKIASKDGDVVLDPFTGSGAISYVAKKLNRNYIGIDINKDSVEMATERLNAI